MLFTDAYSLKSENWLTAFGTQRLLSKANVSIALFPLLK